ncbi:MAG: hypothetical protein NXI25_20575 [bacterium]|nr:hypothetical protein [bacterium]
MPTKIGTEAHHKQQSAAFGDENTPKAAPAGSYILTIKWFATANLLNVSINAEKWLAPALTSYASSVADVANPRFQTMNVWTVSPTFIIPCAGRQRQ